MTFSEIQTHLSDILGVETTTGLARLGRLINARYRAVSASLGIAYTSRRAPKIVNASIGSRFITVPTAEKVIAVYDDTSGTRVTLAEKSPAEIAGLRSPALSDSVAAYSIYEQGSNFVTIQLDVVPQTAFQLTADVFETADTLAGTDTPNFPESFHDILVLGVLADEYSKQEKTTQAAVKEAAFEKRLSELRLHLRASTMLVQQQGGGRSGASTGVGGGTSSSGASGSTSYTQTGLVTFDRDPAVPFAVSASSAYVPNLIADHLHVAATDRLIGRDTAGAGTSEELTVGGGLEFTGSGGIQRSALTGAITAPAASGVTTLAADAVTTVKILDANVTTAKVANDAITYAKLQNVSAASKLLGRGSASGAGDPEEVTVGAGLTMAATTLSAPPPGSTTQVAYNNAGAWAGSANLTFDAANKILAIGSGLKFPATQVPVIDGNTLDDYEEGVWSPTGIGITYSAALGYYIKVGKKVTLWAFVQFPVTANGSGSGLAGIPFTSNATVDAVGSVMSGLVDVLVGYVGASTSTVTFLRAAGQTPATNASMSGLGATVTVTYQASA